MELVFNFAPQEEEENKIKKKVAQKKAIFADLKAEATKILQKWSKANNTINIYILHFLTISKLFLLTKFNNFVFAWIVCRGILANAL